MQPGSVAPSSRPWYRRFHDLMPYRVREILLVSSLYDGFTLEEDGQLTEKISTAHAEVNVAVAPRITRVKTGARALEMLAERRFDLVITMVRIADMDVSAFGRQVRERHPETAVVVLVQTEGDLHHFPGGVDPRAIDRVFMWTGDAEILLTIVKLIEDARNVAHDTEAAGLRVIIVIEDSVRRYSSFLAQLYPELMLQSESLASEGVNDQHRLLRMRSRPKILLATSYEEAIVCYRRYRPFVIGVITDVGLPRGGKEDPGAGFDIVATLLADEPDLPVLIQSAEPENAERAAALDVEFADKNSPNLLRQIGDFVRERLGFGEFVFRLPDRTEVARVRDMFELEQALRVVPAESLLYHATRNHFSMWLMARSAFDLAAQVRPTTPETFGGVEGLRSYLVEAVREELHRQGEGVITDYSPRHRHAHFVRMGRGGMGGKARGLAYVGSLIANEGLRDRFPGLRIATPRTAVICTGEFDRFVEDNRIELRTGEPILDRCLAGRLDLGLLADLRRVHQTFEGPIAVRSSSLLQDSIVQTFAGMYATYMLPNSDPDPEVRFEELCQAIKAVYASTFSEDVRAYVSGTPYSHEEEKMGVIIQEVIGRPYGKRFYPPISGVALSLNYYPVGGQRAEDGVAYAALGFGHSVLHGRAVLQFSPRSPEVTPFASPAELLRYSQTSFYALDRTRTRVDFRKGAESALQLYGLDAAEEDGTLPLVASTWSHEDQAFHDGVGVPGTRVVTFRDVLRWNAIPLAPALAELLDLFSRRLGMPVQMAYSLDCGDPDRPPVLYVLQVRPQVAEVVTSPVDTGAVAPGEVLCRSDRSLGHGIVEGVRDIVYVKRADLDVDGVRRAASEVAFIGARLRDERAPYLLIGPGRWGASDPLLGVPVRWSQIGGARVIVETDFIDRLVEPSQAAQFHHNVSTARIGYLTITDSPMRHGEGQGFLDREWLRALTALYEGEHVRHLRLERPLRVYLDGTRSRATILKPGRPGLPGRAPVGPEDD